MIDYYSPLLTSIKTMFGYKTSALFGASVTSAVSIEIINTLMNGTHLGVSVLLLVSVAFFIILDWLFGSAASRKISLDAKKSGNIKLADKYKFKSSRISATIFKFISLYLWLLLSYTATNYTNGIHFLAPVVETLTIVPILLFGFREYISIGEGIEVLYGSKPFLFEIGEKIFDALQFKFLRKLKGEDDYVDEEYSDEEDYTDEDINYDDHED